ncbi:MAG: hypothetical protein WCW03_02130 [Candidatus Paceibacterota bacterium]|jgi:arginine-tRNA-protein transferase
MKYLKWDEKTITDFSTENIDVMYDNGYLFTRLGKGIMHETRGVRIDLEKFEKSSENRRILRKIQNINFKVNNLPMKDYDWKISKLAKDFYDLKFGPDIMSAQKVKEMLSNDSKSNFNTLLEYSIDSEKVGYAICYQDDAIIHYSYPFYDIESAIKDMGLWMMINAIIYAKDSRKRYIYLGSLQRPNDTYKLQFKGLQWFDGKEWSDDIEKVKILLKK